MKTKWQVTEVKFETRQGYYGRPELDECSIRLDYVDNYITPEFKDGMDRLTKCMHTIEIDTKDFKNEFPTYGKEETIKIKLKKIVINDEACKELGINPNCITKGLEDGDRWVEVGLEKAKELGLV